MVYLFIVYLLCLFINNMLYLCVCANPLQCFNSSESSSGWKGTGGAEQRVSLDAKSKVKGRLHCSSIYNPALGACPGMLACLALHSVKKFAFFAL